jgi:hypothetical protein
VRLILAAVLLLTSCGPSVPAGAGPITPAASPSASSVASASRVASPTPSPAVSVLGNCRLPVATVDSGVGWLDVPGGTFKPDPTSVGHINPHDGSIAWNPAIASWVPAHPESLSPDGTRYVAADTSVTIDIVDARSGSTIAAIPPKYQSDLGVFFILGYTPTAIYLGQTGKNPAPGLWKVDTSSWALSRVTSEGATWSVVDGSIVWGALDGAAGYGGIARVDTSTGVVQEVRPPYEIQFDLAIAGLAGSGVLVVSLPSLQSAEVVNSDGASQAVVIPPTIDGSDLGFPFQDGPDILFASNVGLVAYDPNHGFQLLVTRPDLFKILGPCAKA